MQNSFLKKYLKQYILYTHTHTSLYIYLLIAMQKTNSSKKVAAKK